MKNPDRYQPGQRWEFRTNVPEFERTLVIGCVGLAGDDDNDDSTKHRGPAPCDYSAYVRYSPSAQYTSGFDGVVLAVTAEGLDRSVTRLVETGVELPSWWIYGLPPSSANAAPKGGLHSYACGQDDVGTILSLIVMTTHRRAERSRDRAEALEEHRRKFTGVAAGTPSRSVAESWARIVEWLKEHAPSYPFPLQPGTLASAITAFEDTIGLKLPDDFRDSLRMHDGGHECWLPGRGDLHSLDRILRDWKMYRAAQQEGKYAVPEHWMWTPTRLQGPIRSVFWNTKRIFITDNGSGDHLTLDPIPPATASTVRSLNTATKWGRCMLSLQAGPHYSSKW